VAAYADYRRGVWKDRYTQISQKALEQMAREFCQSEPLDRVLSAIPPEWGTRDVIIRIFTESVRQVQAVREASETRQPRNSTQVFHIEGSAEK
jgi:hypothetical protein